MEADSSSSLVAADCGPEFDDKCIHLRRSVLESMQRQGFVVEGDRILLPADATKTELRDLHREAVATRIKKARGGLYRHEGRLLTLFAQGTEVDPPRVRPKIVQVLPRTEDELLFRYARLHWNIPVSAGYGRRLRFLVYDDHNGKLLGIIGLSDPVYRLRARDEWIGWSDCQRKERLQCVMDAFVLGAVPPYSSLLCGKLVALLMTSDVVRSAFEERYGGRQSVIRQRTLSPSLTVITTTSALGRSSVYNRLSFGPDPGLIRVGSTNGSGEFHFSNGLYADLRAFTEAHCTPTGKNNRWGEGFRNRREVVRKALPLLGLSRELVYHGIRREVFLAPLAKNSAAFLKGDDPEPCWFTRTVASIAEYFRDRWLLPRAVRSTDYKDFNPESLRLWPEAEK